MAELTNSEQGTETKKVTCWASPGCAHQCGLLVNVKDGKIVSMKGNRESPSKGAHCAERFPHFIKWLEHPDQLKYPLKRKGERGENKWERISWEQALNEIADKLKKLKARYGAETLSIIEGTYRSDLYGIRGRFLNLFGNPGNLGTAGTTCGCCREILDIAIAGANCPPLGTFSTNTGLQCMVFCGTHMPGSRPMTWAAIKKRLQEKPRMKIIVIDPRKTEQGEVADIWLQSRPGTDAAMLLSWINVIIEEGIYDKEWVEQWTTGFDDLKKRAQEYTPERVSEITWVPADKIREAARLFAQTKPAGIRLGLSADQTGLNSIRAEQARLCLMAITGNLKPEYGQGPQGPGPIRNGKMGIRDSQLQMEEKCTPEQRKKQLGSDKYKLMAWPAYEITSKYYQQTYGIPQCMSGHSFAVPQPLIWRSILEKKPYPITAMFTWTSNTLLQAANTKLVYKALKSPNLELHVVLEHFMTPTALLADYVLPAASKLERPMLSNAEDFSSFYWVGGRGIQPMGERKHDYYFFREMAIRLGFGEYFPWKTEEELYNYRLEPLGITFEEAVNNKYMIFSDNPWTYETVNPKTGKKTGFATPSGKFELSSNVLKELGYDPLPFYEEPPESPVRTPEIAKKYPLVLTTGGRWMPQFHSEHRQLGMGLREQHPDPLVEIHPDTAHEYGIVEGDWTYIETLRGVIKMKAKLSTGIHPRVVNCEASWWFPEQPAQEPWLHGLWESNANVLTTDEPETLDPITGGWASRSLLCRIYKVQTV
jgi:thiosulfate reductase / polysulfide reductase chain A